MNDVAILHSGMVTGVGLNAPASCAAIRVGISGAEETRFMFDGEWLMGCEVPLEQPWRGREKLLRMIVPALQECLESIPKHLLEQVPLLLCVAELERPGRFAGLDDSFLHEVHERLSFSAHPDSKIIAGGHIGPVQALIEADRLISAGRPYCVVAGVDTLLTGPTLAHYHERRRLLTPDNSNGFIPGEAAAAVLLTHAQKDILPQLCCTGIGFGTEKVTIDSKEPLRGDGLAAAIKLAFADCGYGYEKLHYRLTDLNGEQYFFKEMALAESRTLRARKEAFDIWHPTECIGDVGAAIVPVVLGEALFAARKGYAPGPGVLCHFSSDAETRAALILHYVTKEAA